VAFIGFSFRLQLKGWSTGAAFLYLVPLGFLLSAFMTKLGPLAPKCRSCGNVFSALPCEYVEEGRRRRRERVSHESAHQ
jgi:hypothetical protein